MRKHQSVQKHYDSADRNNLTHIAYLDPKTDMLADASGLIYVNMMSRVLIQMLQNVRADYPWE